jgi:signal peptidase
MLKYKPIFLAILALLFLIFLSSTPLRLFFVASGSMEPDIPTGSIIAVKSNPQSVLEPGLVITYQKDNILITHRIVDIGHDGSFYYITKGDANLGPDPEPVRHHQVTGKVVFVTPPFMAPALRYFRKPRVI